MKGRRRPIAKLPAKGKRNRHNTPWQSTRYMKRLTKTLMCLKELADAVRDFSESMQSITQWHVRAQEERILADVEEKLGSD